MLCYTILANTKLYYKIFSLAAPRNFEDHCGLYFAEQEQKTLPLDTM